MRAFLMHRDRDFQPEWPLPWNESSLAKDLELDTMLDAMGDGDDFVRQMARRALLLGLGNDVDTILYRQEALKDCLNNPAVVRGLYALAAEAVETARREWWGSSSHYPTSMLYGAINLLEIAAARLEKLRAAADERAAGFESAAFVSLFSSVRRELSDDYLKEIRGHLAHLKFRKGVLLSAALGAGNAGTGYALRQDPERDLGLLDRVFGRRPPMHTFHIAERDQTGADILTDMQHRGIRGVAVALAESADHVLSFFKALRTELAFYVGCLNLHGRLAARGKGSCFPAPAHAGERLRFEGLYDVCLALRLGGRVVANTADADRRRLVVVTGANQGGKSTFLRSLGVAQLMMQCGMFACAASLTTTVCPSLITHFRREEDPTMKSGKLDEELVRMSDIVDHVVPKSVLLFNESFAATNEREGSEIARQIVSALLEKNIRVIYVTHLYEFARLFAEKGAEHALFLRAERRSDGTRTFRLVEGEPLDTSYGEDLYRKVFGDDGDERAAASGLGR